MSIFGYIRTITCIILLALGLVACGAAPEANQPELDDIEQQESSEETTELEPTPTATTEAATPTSAGPMLQEGPAKDSYAVGDTARLNAFLVRVDEVETTNKTEMGTAQEGNQFVLVRITLENTSSETQEIAPLLHMSVQDAKGEEYALDIGASMDVLSINGSFPAHTVETATIGYQVPQNAEGLQWTFRTTAPDAAQGLKETGKVVFDLKP